MRHSLTPRQNFRLTVSRLLSGGKYSPFRSPESGIEKVSDDVPSASCTSTEPSPLRGSCMGATGYCEAQGAWRGLSDVNLAVMVAPDAPAMADKAVLQD